MYWLLDYLTPSGYSYCCSFLVLCLLIVAILGVLASPLSWFHCSSLLHCWCIRLGSSIEYALSSTVSSKRRRGVVSFFLKFFDMFVCRSWDRVFRFSVLWIRTLGSRIVGSVGSIPAIFRFIRFAASVAFEQIAHASNNLTVVFPCLLPFVALHFPATSFKMVNFIAIDVITIFGVLGSACFVSTWA